MTNPPNVAADVIDAGFINTYGQIEYLAIAYAIMGGNTSVSNTNLFKFSLSDFQYHGGNQRHFVNEENVPISQHLASNKLYNCLVTPRPGLDLSDAITYFVNRPYAAPIGNGAPTDPYDDRFMQFFNWRHDPTSKKFNYFTYTEIYNAPDTRGEYEDSVASFHAMPFVVIPVKNYDISHRVQVNHQSNEYLPIKGYFWDNATNSLKTKTYQTWDDVDAADLVTDYVLLVNFERSDFGATNKHDFNCNDIICGDGFCNEHCADCPTDCNLQKFKLELTEVTISEDVKITNLPSAVGGVKEINWRERSWDGKYAIHYACAVVHTDGSIESIEEARFGQQRFKKKEVKRTKVEYSNITGTISTKGASTPHTSTTDLLSNNFRPNFPNGDKIYIMFWEDDRNGVSPSNFIEFLPRKNPGNVVVGSNPIKFPYQSKYLEYPFGTKYNGNTIFGWNNYIDDNGKLCSFDLGAKPCADAPFYHSFNIEDPSAPPFPNSQDHVLIIDFSDFTPSNSNTSGEFIFNDAIETGNTSNNPMRGGKYGLSFKMKWSQKL